MHRITRIAALSAAVVAAALTLGAGTASAGADQYEPCDKHNVVCAPINADVLNGLDVDVLNILRHGHH